MKDKNLINHDAIFINGLSGDFITGGHADLKNKNKNMTGSFDIRKEIILNKLIEKHFSLWGYLKNNYNMKIIKNNLWNEIIKGCGDLENENLDHLLFEYSELIGRQSKYVVKKQKVYEFYGYEWRMPFWDDQYLKFWQRYH